MNILTQAISKSRRRQLSRLADGQQIAEVGPALWLVFSILFFPLLAFGTIGIRCAFFVYAARLAASTGAQCLSFQTDLNPPTSYSATTIANQIATQAMNSFSGLTLTKTNCYIVVCPLAGSAPSKQSTPLSQPANTNANAYNFEVVLQGQLSPLVANPSNWFGKVPGLNSPLTTSARADVFFENTQGLNQ